MGQHKNKPRYENMTMVQELQARMNDITKTAEWLIEARMVDNWKILEMPDGEKVIALVLPSRLWTLKDGKIVFSFPAKQDNNRAENEII